MMVGLLFGGMYKLAIITDLKNKNEIWQTRFWDVGFSGIFIFIMSWLGSIIKSTSNS